MDVIISNIQNTGNLFINKYVIHEDPKINTYIQIILSSIFATIIGYVLTNIKSGTFIVSIRWNLRLLMFWKKYEPYDFYPQLAPQLSHTHIFTYTHMCMDTTGIVRWIMKYHGNKLLRGTNNSNMIVIQDQDIKYTNGDIPIWYENGSYVYISKRGGYQHIGISSDNLIALEHFQQHVSDFTMGDNSLHKRTSNKRKIFKMERGMAKQIGEIGHKQTFEYLYFDRKSEIVSLLDKYKSGTMYPKNIPIENKLGILLHGAPGCGKTRFVSACANYLDMNILIIDITKLTTCNDFDYVLDAAKTNNAIIMIDEIDCMEGVINRTPVNPSALGETPTMSLTDKLLVSCNDKDMIQERIATEKNKLNLGYLLSKLDGIESSDGRVIIATTNYPDRIDKALLRPGRIGVSLHMSKCSHQMIVDILTMMFGEIANSQIEQITTCITPFQVSPAEIIQQSVVLNDIDMVIRELVETYNPTIL